MDKILILAKKLIKISNPTEALKLCLTELKDFKLEKFTKNGYPSALIHNQKKSYRQFKIILNGHLDVIPGKSFQYTPKISKDRLSGVGSMDMKSNVACLIAVFKKVANKVKYPIALQLVTDEEIGGLNGTKYQVDQGVRADLVIAGETTNFQITNQAKGILWLKISTLGKTAHGAYPWKGDNAVWKMQHFLSLLAKKFPNPKKPGRSTSVNLARIETKNQAFNKIPDDCSVWLDIRFPSRDENSILKKIKSLLSKSFSLKVILKEPAIIVNKNNKIIKILKAATEKIMKSKAQYRQAQGSSDARHFTKINCPAIEFGPIGGRIGTDKEWVSIKSLEKYCKEKNIKLKDYM